jgi:glutamyl-tRNA synthetase
VTARVRFAPSPTGSLHIGSVRTTLYNYFFARHNKGTLVLRIEDTDQDRLVAGAVDSIYDGFRWLGISWDEGPREGGPHAPYIQSERLPAYQRAAQELVEAGAAYFCFCSKERLAAMRAQQQQRGEITKYDRHCRTIDPQEAAERARTEPHVVRLKVPDDGLIGVDDLVYGRVEWPINTIEDQVLLKSDGFPTYHLAVVVDDHTMGITHIFRGEDWLPSTPKHLLVYRAFGWDIPPIAHFPNVLGADGKKLAKRHGATKVDQFRADGYLPEAMVNYLAFLGWSPGTEEEIFTLAELAERFDIGEVHKAGAVFDKDRLDYLNGVYIRSLADGQLADRLRPFLPPALDDGIVMRLAPLLKERLVRLGDATELSAFLTETDADVAALYDPELLLAKGRSAEETTVAIQVARDALAALAEEDFAAGELEAICRFAAEAHGWKAGDFFRPLRVAITGRLVSPPLFGSMELLGRERTLSRIDAAIARLGG